MYKIMTPGPTQVAENVRLARSMECTNPDLDEDFVEFYKETCEKISSLLHTSNETLNFFFKLCYPDRVLLINCILKPVLRFLFHPLRQMLFRLHTRHLHHTDIFL